MENNETYLDEKTRIEYETRLEDVKQRLDNLEKKYGGRFYSDEDYWNEYYDLQELGMFLQCELDIHYNFDKCKEFEKEF